MKLVQILPLNCSNLSNLLLSGSRSTQYFAQHCLACQIIHSSASKIGPNGPNWQCCLAGSSKTAPRILILSIAMGADYSFYVKFIATSARAFLGYNNSVLSDVSDKLQLFRKHWRATSIPINFRPITMERCRAGLCILIGSKLLVLQCSRKTYSSAD